jgi:hypothetical protein
MRRAITVCKREGSTTSTAPLAPVVGGSAALRCATPDAMLSGAEGAAGAAGGAGDPGRTQDVRAGDPPERPGTLDRVQRHAMHSSDPARERRDALRRTGGSPVAGDRRAGGSRDLDTARGGCRPSRGHGRCRSLRRRRFVIGGHPGDAKARDHRADRPGRSFLGDDSQRAC